MSYISEIWPKQRKHMTGDQQKHLENTYKNRDEEETWPNPPKNTKSHFLLSHIVQ